MVINFSPSHPLLCFSRSCFTETSTSNIFRKLMMTRTSEFRRSSTSFTTLITRTASTGDFLTVGHLCRNPVNGRKRISYFVIATYRMHLEEATLSPTTWSHSSQKTLIGFKFIGTRIFRSERGWPRLKSTAFMTSDSTPNLGEFKLGISGHQVFYS